MVVFLFAADFDCGKEASRLGVTRQSISKIWLAERLEQLADGK
ncbi:hypothetical protein [Nitrosomonas sp.]|nr:hypothetical protein [Nitrosomonas sp.]MDP2225314.1 hypothetical protein [Nitrosomonas sp.]